jgi:alkaline phosphatase
MPLPTLGFVRGHSLPPREALARLMIMERRDFLKTGAAALAGGALLTGCAPAAHAPLAAPTERSPNLPVGRARNIIFYAYDGFNVEDLAVGRYFAARHLDGRVLALERLFARGATGMALTHSLTSVVTDSAAGSVAWATGRKVVNGAVSLLPDGRRLSTVLELARDAGRATGLITTTRVTHATPAAWAAWVPDRGMEDQIAIDYLRVAPQVVLGGGARHFDPQYREDGRDLYGEYRGHGYSVLRTAEELAATNASRVLGTFALDHVPYEIDRRFQGVPAPTLADMTRKGLEILAGYERGFVAQVEAGRIDHANHANDPATMLWDLIAADDALHVILDFIGRHPDTLLIVVSDHGTGSGSVYGTGSKYLRSTPAFDRLARQRASYWYVADRLGDDPAPVAVRALVQRELGVTLGAVQAQLAADILARRTIAGHPLAHRDHPSNSFHWALTAGTEEHPEVVNINYATGAHTAGPVPLIVYGVGIRSAALGVVDNTVLFDWMLHTLGVRFQNPGMTEEEALRLSAGREPREMQVA